MTFRRRGITQKKEYNNQNTTKAWNKGLLIYLLFYFYWFILYISLCFFILSFLLSFFLFSSQLSIYLFHIILRIKNNYFSKQCHNIYFHNAHATHFSSARNRRFPYIPHEHGCSTFFVRFVSRHFDWLPFLRTVRCVCHNDSLYLTVSSFICHFMFILFYFSSGPTLEQQSICWSKDTWRHIKSSSSCSWRVRRVSCSLILKMKLVPPSLPRSSYVSSSFWLIL